jgi:hypothetical protein
VEFILIMSKTPSNYALTILGSAEIRTVATVSELQAKALDQLVAIPRIEREAALRAILCGLALHRVKVSLPHGEFVPWLEKCTTGALLVEAGLRQARYYMRLALVAVDSTKASVPEILALPGGQAELALENQDEAARRLMTKLMEFVGERSLNQLLGDLGIKDRKTAHTHGDHEEKKPTEAEHAQTVQESINAIAEHVRVARDDAVRKVVCMSMTRQQRADLKFLFTEAASQVAETYGRIDRGTKSDCQN